MLSYRNKLQTSGSAGVTSEMSALTTYVAAALVYRDQFWIATTITVASMLLLELKAALEGLTRRIAPEEILTFTKFLLLTAVILPVLPNREFGPFDINPAKTWLVVVAVSAVSYGSYVIQKLTREQGGVILAALLGGAYSSTVTTVVLAKRAKRENRPHLFSGATLVASGVMYLRLAGLVTIFNRNLIRFWECRFWRWRAPASGADGCGAGFPMPRRETWSASSNPKTRWNCVPPWLRRDLRRHPGGHAPGGDLSGPGGGVLAGGVDGSDGRGPVHHGNDARRPAARTAGRGGGGDSDCRRQQ